MIYLDNNATTCVAPSVRDALWPFLTEHYANPSSPYGFAHRSADALACSRQAVASLLRVHPSDVFFTSGGTESINTVFEVARRHGPDKDHLVISAVEHAAVMACARRWVADGGRMTMLGVDTQGGVDLTAYAAALTPDTALVSLMAANNETGVCFPVEDCAAMAEERGVLFHCDATQAVGKIPFSGDLPGLRLLSLSGHKFHAPKGVGALIVREVPDWPAWIVGGEQEQGRRAGTENVPGIAGLGAAARLAISGADLFERMLRPWRDEMEAVLKSRIPDLVIAGEGAPRLANTSFFCVPDAPSEAVLANLDMVGICCSSGSACSSGAAEPSHVLRAMGMPRELSGCAVRVSFGRFSLREEVDALLEHLPPTVEQVRNAH